MNVAVIILTENKRDEMLRKAISSCFAQSEPISQVIVVNDGLTSLSLPPDNRLTIGKTAGQIGLSGARQIALGLLAPSIDAVSYLDDDDELMPNHSSVLVPLLKDHAFATSIATFRHADGRTTTDPEPNNRNAKYYDPSALLEQNIAPVSSYIHRRHASVGWDETIIRMEDWDFWGRMFIRHGPPAISRETTNLINKHGNNLSGGSSLSYSMSCSWRDVVSDRLRHMSSQRRWFPNADDLKRFHVPKIGVVMPIFNAEKYLPDALGSLLDQTFEDFEILAIDDASEDASRVMLETIAKVDKRLRIFDMPNHSGVAKSLNFGVLVSRSEFVARMDADDISLSTRFEKQVNFLNSNKEISLVGTSFESRDETMEKIVWQNNIGGGAFEIARRLKTSNCIGHPTVMMRRRALEQLGGYNETPDFLGAEDYELWARMSLRGYKMANLSDILLLHRTHENQITNIIKPNTQLIKDMLK